jgi:hypothetical protein
LESRGDEVVWNERKKLVVWKRGDEFDDRSKS